MNRLIFYKLILVIWIFTSCESKKVDFLYGDWVTGKFEMKSRHGVIALNTDEIKSFDSYLPTYFSISFNPENTFRIFNLQLVDQKLNNGANLHFKTITGSWTRNGDSLILWRNEKIWLNGIIKKTSSETIDLKINRVQFLDIHGDSSSVFTGERCLIELQKQNSN